MAATLRDGPAVADQDPDGFVAAADGLPAVPALGVSRAAAQLTAGLGGFKSAWAGPVSLRRPSRPTW
jgi:hypothetical protein